MDPSRKKYFYFDKLQKNSFEYNASDIVLYYRYLIRDKKNYIS